MKKESLIFVLALLTSVTAWAGDISISESGFAQGFCEASMGQGCIDDIDNRAESQGKLNVTASCQAQNGRVGFITCNTSCNPPDLFPGEPSQFVTCSSYCSGLCEGTTQ